MTAATFAQLQQRLAEQPKSPLEQFRDEHNDTSSELHTVAEAAISELDASTELFGLARLYLRARNALLSELETTGVTLR